MHMSLHRRIVLGAALAAVLAAPQQAAAQLDQLLYLKRNKPNVLIAVDTSERMQLDTNGDYRDNNVYIQLGGPDKSWEDALGIAAANTNRFYRRKYVGLQHTDPGSGAFEQFNGDHIEIVGDRQAAYATFDEATRIAIAKRGLTAALTANTAVARFGLLRTRQQFPRYETPPGANATTWLVNEEPVRVLNGAYPLQQLEGDSLPGEWKITRPRVDVPNGSVGGPVGPLVAADAAGANASVLNVLGLSTGAASSLIPAGRDSMAGVDSPLDAMLIDLKTEAARLIAANTTGANTVAIVVTGGGEGVTSGGANPVATASQFLNIGGRRVPIYVIAIAPLSAADRTQLQGIAAASGGQFTEITLAMVAATTPGQAVPELVRAVNVAISHAFGKPADVNLPPDATHPYGYETRHQVTSPIVGTVNLTNALDINGASLPNTVITDAVSGATIPQRSNVMITTGYALPGFLGRIRASRVYKPVSDPTKPSGYKFVVDGTRLWEASTPAAAQRNIFTALPNGTMVAFNAANAAILAPYLKTATPAAAAARIAFVRSQPLGAIIGSTPAMMDAPSLDPPPDADYPAFSDANKDRRSIIWVGANDGMIHAIDARLGVEVWAFVPFNLLPKLGELEKGQAVGAPRFFADGSPKVADVKVGGQWRTHMVIGEGEGGTFYQTFDVTLPNIAASVAPDSDNLANLLNYFSLTTSVPLRWAFPQYSEFDVNIGAWGDIAAAALPVSKTVGQTWSDPAVGQIGSPLSPWVVLTGSGHLNYSVQQQANRSGTVAGNVFYMLDMATGAVLDSRSVGSDGIAETVDNCAAAAVNDCTAIKNALQSDPVATGPSESRFISKVYMGDLDGKVWRFGVGLDASNLPVIQSLVNLYAVGGAAGGGGGSAGGGGGGGGAGGGGAVTPAIPRNHPIFASMATVSIGPSQQYLFFGTGSDLLPSNNVNYSYKLLIVLDQGASGLQTGAYDLVITDGIGADEKVSSFPAVAGDIVFFTTTTYFADPTIPLEANLYAMTFIGGPAYDTNGDNTLNSSDSVKINTTVGSRGTAPFVVDQHLVFGTGDTVQLFGDPEDFNNGVGQVGVRILSWREAR